MEIDGRKAEKKRRGNLAAKNQRSEQSFGSVTRLENKSSMADRMQETELLEKKGG